MHRTLALAIAAESHPTTLTRIIKACLCTFCVTRGLQELGDSIHLSPPSPPQCLSLLVTNTPYHQLSKGYLSRVTSTLLPCTTHRGTLVDWFLAGPAHGFTHL